MASVQDLSRGVFALFFAWKVSQTFSIETKRKYTSYQRDTPTFISITGARALTIVNSVFSVMARLIVEMLLICL